MWFDNLSKIILLTFNTFYYDLCHRLKLKSNTQKNFVEPPHVDVIIQNNFMIKFYSQ